VRHGNGFRQFGHVPLDEHVCYIVALRHHVDLGMESVVLASPASWTGRGASTSVMFVAHLLAIIKIAQSRQFRTKKNKSRTSENEHLLFLICGIHIRVSDLSRRHSHINISQHAKEDCSET
jgi:hypothetical protein